MICKGDNGHWEPNYSAILAASPQAASPIFTIPKAQRANAAVTFENALIGIGETAAVNLLQEFVMRKFTPKPLAPTINHAVASLRRHAAGSFQLLLDFPCFRHSIIRRTNCRIKRDRKSGVHRCVFSSRCLSFFALLS